MKWFIIVLLACVTSTFAQVSDAELRAVSSDIWDADINSLSSSQYSIDPSGSKFFTYVNESAFAEQTYKALLNLLDDYIPFTGTPDPDTPERLRDQQEFLEAVISTAPMQILWEFLVSKGLANSTRDGFIDELKQYWFMLYSRSGGVLDSSGFEHVFVGEIVNGVGGLHNWVQFYVEEQAGTLSYTEFQDSCEPRVYSMSIRWLNNDKPITSIFVGTSPEYDFAVLTLCFVTRGVQEDKLCPTITAGHDGHIHSFTQFSSPITVGSAYAVC